VPGLWIEGRKLEVADAAKKAALKKTPCPFDIRQDINGNSSKL
jgi:hypothetical protein